LSFFVLSLLLSTRPSLETPKNFRLPSHKINSFFLVLSPAAKETMKRHVWLEKKEVREGAEEELI
jgi:hypothetical protein